MVVDVSSMTKLGGKELIRLRRRLDLIEMGDGGGGQGQGQYFIININGLLIL
jgi:hypothetical protein